MGNARQGFQMPHGGPWGGKRISQPAQQQANPSTAVGSWDRGAALSDEEKMRRYEEKKARWEAVPGSMPYWGTPPGSNPGPVIDPRIGRGTQQPIVLPERRPDQIPLHETYGQPAAPMPQQQPLWWQQYKNPSRPNQQPSWWQQRMAEQGGGQRPDQQPQAGYEQNMPPWAQGPHQQLIQESRLASQLGNLGVGTAGLNSLFASDTQPRPLQQPSQERLDAQAGMNERWQQWRAEQRTRQNQQRPMSAGTPRNMDRFNQAVENAGLAGINRSDWSDVQRQDFRAARRAIPRGANGGLVSQMRNRNPLPASRWSLPHYRNLV